MTMTEFRSGLTQRDVACCTARQHDHRDLLRANSKDLPEVPDEEVLEEERAARLDPVRVACRILPKLVRAQGAHHCCGLFLQRGRPVKRQVRTAVLQRREVC